MSRPRETIVAASPFPETTVLAEEEIDPFTIRCLTKDGVAVNAATVWVFQFGKGNEPDSSSTYRRYGPFETNSKGECECPVLANDGRWSRMIYASRAGEWVGIGYRTPHPEMDGKPSDVSEPITMLRATTLKGTIEVPALDIPKSTRVDVLSISTNGTRPWGNQMVMDSFSLHEYPALRELLPPKLITTPDAQGRFTLQDIPEGAMLHVGVQADGYGEAQFMRSFDQEMDEVQVSLSLAGSVRGQVLDADERPLSDVPLALTRVGDAVVQRKYTAVSDKDGVFSFDGLAQDSYRLEAEEESWRFLPPGEIEVKSGEETELEFREILAGKVVGVVRDSQSGAPLPEVLISAVRSNAETGFRQRFGFTRSDDAGEFELEVPTGECFLCINGVPEGYTYPTHSHRGRQVIGKAIEVTGQKPLAVELKVPPLPSGSVRLAVKTPQGSPLAEVPVHLVQVESREEVQSPQSLFTMTNQAGEYHWLGVPKGTYYGVAGETFTTKTDHFEIEGDAITRTILRDLRRIVLRVRDTDGRTLDEFDVRVERLGTDESLSVSSTEIPREGISIPAGEYRITVSRPGYQDRSHDVSARNLTSPLLFILRRE